MDRTEKHSFKKKETLAMICHRVDFHVLCFAWHGMACQVNHPSQSYVFSSFGHDAPPITQSVCFKGVGLEVRTRLERATFFYFVSSDRAHTVRCSVVVYLSRNPPLSVPATDGVMSYMGRYAHGYCVGRGCIHRYLVVNCQVKFFLCSYGLSLSLARIWRLCPRSPVQALFGHRWGV